MTGLELLKAEMIRRGCTKQQTESKVVPVVLDIVSQSGNTYHATETVRDNLKALQSSLSFNRIALERAREELNQTRNEINALKGERDEAIRAVEGEAVEYIEKFYKALEDMETPEGRDRLKAAQVFINSVNVETKYDNTAFIVALGSLLSGVQYSPLDELKKINKKIGTQKSLGRI